MVLLAMDEYVHQPIEIGVMILILLKAATRGRASLNESSSEYYEREQEVSPGVVWAN